MNMSFSSLVTERFIIFRCEINSLVTELLARCGGLNISLPEPRNILHFWVEKSLIPAHLVIFRREKDGREKSDGDLCGKTELLKFLIHFEIIHFHIRLPHGRVVTFSWGGVGVVHPVAPETISRKECYSEKAQHEEKLQCYWTWEGSLAA